MQPELMPVVGPVGWIADQLDDHEEIKKLMHYYVTAYARLKAALRVIAETDKPATFTMAQKIAKDALEFADRRFASVPKPSIVPDASNSRLLVTATDEQLSALSSRMQGKPGDLLLFVADAFPITCKALYGLRKKLGAELGLYDPKQMHFSWVVEFPMFHGTSDEGLHRLDELLADRAGDRHGRVDAEAPEVRGSEAAARAAADRERRAARTGAAGG